MFEYKTRCMTTKKETTYLIVDFDILGLENGVRSLDDLLAGISLSPEKWANKHPSSPVLER